MRSWLYQHRHVILAVYVAVAITVVLILQLLETQGRLP